MTRSNKISWMDRKVWQAAHGTTVGNDLLFQRHNFERALRNRRTGRSLSPDAMHFITGDKTKRGALRPRLLKAASVLR